MKNKVKEQMVKESIYFCNLKLQLDMVTYLYTLKKKKKKKSSNFEIVQEASIL